MLVHATDAYPYGYYWYKKINGDYTCSSKPSTHSIKTTFCNRVERLPLVNYLTDYQYGFYSYMLDPSLIGIHIERLA